jgi:hypothetical protein
MMKARNPQRPPAAPAARPTGTGETTAHTTPASQKVFILMDRSSATRIPDDQDHADIADVGSTLVWRWRST